MKSRKKERLKCIVETRGDFTMLNVTGETIHSHRPTLVIMTPFIEEAIHEKKLRSLATSIPAKAEDNDFRQVYLDSKKDKELAVKSFCAAHGVDVQGDPLDEIETPPVKKDKIKKKEDTPNEGYMIGMKTDG